MLWFLRFFMIWEKKEGELCLRSSHSSRVRP